ncbi:MAG: hypothetical protein FWD93_03500 [Coriobacteriia bacterium]|nr:hypothetical protein [Coriobacteriia bacterium]
MNPFVLPEQQYGTTLESLLERRERVAKSEGTNYGSSKLFKGLAGRVLRDVRPGSRILEIDAGAGLFTRLFLKRGCVVTAFEPAPVLYDMLTCIDDENLTTHCGFIEEQYPLDDDLNDDGADEGDSLFTAPFDSAIVTFPARRGRGILALICALLPLVNEKVLVVLPDNGSVDLSSLLRSVSLRGYYATAEFVVDLPAVRDVGAAGQGELSQIKRAILISVAADPLIPQPLCPSQVLNVWGSTVRTIDVPYPVPRGATTRLIRYFRAGGDRSILIKTDAQGMHHLYGNMRTAANRIARDQVSVRRVDNGIMLMRVPPSESGKNQ